MDAFWLQLAVVVVLLLLNAVLAGSEVAMISLREGQLARLEGQGAAGRKVAMLARDPNRFMSTVQIGITLTGFLASATAAVTLAEPLVGVLSPLGQAARPTAILLVVLALSLIAIVVGELVPKRLAMQRAERWGLIVARPLTVLAAAARPLIWMLGQVTNLLVRLLGGEASVDREVITGEELREMLDRHPGLAAHQRSIIREAFEVADRRLRDVLVPRPHVVGLPHDTDAGRAVTQLLEAGHSRAPVYHGDLDHVVGTVHLRDLIGTGGSVEELGRAPLALPETLGILHALQELQFARQEMALVINEHGSTEGIVTVEDLVEELVGEIRDGAVPEAHTARQELDGSVTVPGTFPILGLRALGIELPSGEYATIAGLVLARLGRVPEPGEAITVGEMRLEVVRATPRAIRQVRVTREGERQPSRAAGN